MKDHVEIGHLTKYEAFRMNRGQVKDLEIWFKIITRLKLFRRKTQMIDCKDIINFKRAIFI